MRINVGGALKAPGHPFDFGLEQRLGAIAFSGSRIETAAPVRLSGTFQGQKDGSVRVQGTLETVLRLQCSRCTGSFKKPVHLSFNEEFRKESPGADSDGYLFEGEWIDLTEMAEALIILDLPIQSLCSPDCPGLCPVCGKDLREGGCGCAPPTADDGYHNDFLKLKALLEDDKEV